MTDSPKEPTAEASPSSEGTFNQDDIDALLNAAAGEPDGDAGAAGDAASSPAAGASADAAPDARVDSMGRPFDEMAAAMQAAIEGEKADTASQPPPSPAPASQAPPTVMKSLELPDFGGALADLDAKRVSMLADVNLNVKIELGRTRLLVEEVLKLGEGSVVELDKLAGDPVDVFANERLIARGEVLVLNDSFCVRISEVFSHDPHRVSQ